MKEDEHLHRNTEMLSGPLEHTIVFDLLAEKITPTRGYTNVARYFIYVSRWFKKELLKEEIPADIIEKATITWYEGGETCEIVAQGRTFKAEVQLPPSSVNLENLERIAHDVLVGGGEYCYDYDSIELGQRTQPVVIDLLTEKITPPIGGDDIGSNYLHVRNYLHAKSKWFRNVLSKEGIPIHILEKATITLWPKGGETCEIVVQGRKSEATTLGMKRSLKK